jgi:TP901 family phage tail tape measure protein
VAREVEEVKTRTARQEPTTRAGSLPDARTQTRRITQETGEVEGNTKAWERNAAARQQANKAGERRTAGGLIVPGGADSGRVSTDPSALARVNQQTAEANAKAREYAQLQSRVGAIRERAASTVGMESQALQRQIQVYGSSSQALRKHGALTTEFIQEAARGNVTFAEMRYQVGATIAKFSGWTAAAASVYGVLGAIQAVGRGAIDSSNGVNQLQRVINHVDSRQAQSGFRDMSSKFNLPISDVSDAQYQLGKVFGDQNQALAGTPALLYAVKVGELSVADASKFLIATTNAYSLSVDQLTPLLDQYNSLQNNLGVNIRDTAAGVAKAGGQFRAAGGDLTQLIAIVGAGTKVTGLSGDQFGTLLQRSAGLVSRPKNQEILKSFGLDPTKDITALYDAAFKLAPTLQRRQLVKLAEGLSTPQLAPRFTALLSRPDIYNRALNLVQPNVAAGSAQRELDRQLGSISERAKRLVTDLERVGSVLAEGGAFVVPGAFIAGLDHALRLVVAIGEGMINLPGPLGQAVIPLLTMVGLLKTIRRFNIGDSLASRTTPELARFLNQRPETRARRLVGAGIDRETTFFQDERERVARQAAVASRRTSTQRDRLDRVLAVTPQNAPAEQLREVERQQNALNAARRVERELIEEEALLSEQIAATEARGNRFRADVVKGRQSALGFARAEGIYLPSTVATPTTQRPFRVGPTGQRVDTRAQALEARLGAAITGRDASLVFADRQRVFNAALASSGRNFNLIERAALRTTSGIARARARRSRAAPPRSGASGRASPASARRCSPASGRSTCCSSRRSRCRRSSTGTRRRSARRRRPSRARRRTR